ncbi:hypothetical protein H5410_057252, partial [Solanum commersonii]
LWRAGLSSLNNSAVCVTSPSHLLFNTKCVVDSVTFGEKPDIAKRTWRLAKRPFVHPLSAPLYPLCIALGESPKKLHVLRTDSLNPFGELPKGLILAFCSSVLSPEINDQIGSEKEQSACRRVVPQSSTKLPNDPKYDDAKGQSKMVMKPTKGRIADPSPTHSARESEWEKAEAILHAELGVREKLSFFGLPYFAFDIMLYVLWLLYLSVRRMRSPKALNDSPRVFFESPKGLILTFYSSVLSPERKDQIGGENEQSTCRRVVPQSIQLERVKPSPSSTHSTRESEWAKAEVVLHAATPCSRETKLIRVTNIQRIYYQKHVPNSLVYPVFLSYPKDPISLIAVRGHLARRNVEEQGVPNAPEVQPKENFPMLSLGKG